VGELNGFSLGRKGRNGSERRENSRKEAGGSSIGNVAEKTGRSCGRNLCTLLRQFELGELKKQKSGMERQGGQRRSLQEEEILTILKAGVKKKIDFKGLEKGGRRSQGEEDERPILQRKFMRRFEQVCAPIY